MNKDKMTSSKSEVKEECLNLIQGIESLRSIQQGKTNECQDLENRVKNLVSDYSGEHFLLVMGNKKLDKSIGILNMPPIKSCPNCSECATSCYAVPSYRQYPAVRVSQDLNFWLAKNMPTLFWERIMKDITNLLKTGKLSAVRYHSSGDIFSKEYGLLLNSIAENFPELPFYCYTKSENAPEYSKYNVINSFIDEKLNFGTIWHCADLVTNHGAFLCPATVKEGIMCGRDCNYCVTGSKPCFVQHGNGLDRKAYSL